MTRDRALERDLSPIEQVIVAAYDSQIDYAEGYQISARQMDESQLPIIAAAGLASLVLFQNPASARDILAGIGVGAGVYSSTRSVLLPRRMPELYITGHAALGCIRAESPYFTGTIAQSTHGAFKASARDIARVTFDAREVYATSVISAQAPEPKRRDFQAAMVALNDAVVAATQALNTANRQLGAFDRADSVFGAAVADVHIRVATKARDGRVVEFGQLRQAYTESIQAAGVPAPASGMGSVRSAASQTMLASIIGTQPAAGASDDEVIDHVWKAARALSLQTQTLTSETPDYVASLTRVAVCSSGVQ